MVQENGWILPVQKSFKECLEISLPEGLWRRVSAENGGIVDLVESENVQAETRQEYLRFRYSSKEIGRMETRHLCDLALGEICPHHLDCMRDDEYDDPRCGVIKAQCSLKCTQEIDIFSAQRSWTKYISCAECICRYQTYDTSTNVDLQRQNCMLAKVRDNDLDRGWRRPNMFNSYEDLMSYMFNVDDKYEKGTVVGEVRMDDSVYLEEQIQALERDFNGQGLLQRKIPYRVFERSLGVQRDIKQECEILPPNLRVTYSKQSKTCAIDPLLYDLFAATKFIDRYGSESVPILWEKRTKCRVR